jgi:hypothetical protein
VTAGYLSVAAIALLLGAGPAVAAPPSSLKDQVQAISASFICPEQLANDGERADMRQDLSRRLAALRLSFGQAQRVVDTLMTIHGCAPSGLVPARLTNAAR